MPPASKTMDSEPRLVDLADVLTWKLASSTPVVWRTRYENLIERHIRATAQKSEEALAIVDALALLPHGRQRAFLRAPLVASRVLGHMKGERFDAGPIVKSLMAELAIEGIDCDLFEPAWTALGDRMVNPGAGATCREGERIPNTSIVVDSAGPIDFSLRQGSRTVHPSENERTSVVRKLARAAHGIAMTSIPAFQLWQESVDAIAIRTSANAAPFSSGSLNFNARVSLFLNAHGRDVNQAEIADGLLHEAIHSLLFMFEETAGAFVSGIRTAEDETKIVSPWSGNILFLPAFTHACVVWYGLFWFWQAALDRQSWQTRHSQFRRDRARAGFEKRPSVMISSDCRSRLSPEFGAALEVIEQRICAT
jgi:hypothetical protein